MPPPICWGHNPSDSTPIAPEIKENKMRLKRRHAVFILACCALAAIIAWCNPVKAETVGEQLDKALGEIEAVKAETEALKQKLGNEIADRTENDALLNGTIQSLQSFDEDLLRRVEALEAGSPSPEPPGPFPNPVPAAFPNTEDGKPIMQVGLAPIGYASLLEPYINLLHQNGCSWTAIGPPAGKVEIGCGDLLAQGFLDQETLDPKAKPPGYVSLRSGLFRFGVRYYPEYFAGTYVFEWDGKATAKCGFNHATKVVSENRIECVYTPAHRDWSNVELTSVGEGFKNPRLYRKENEALINAGAVFEPRFVDHCNDYKIIRTLDPQEINTSWLRSVSKMATKKQTGWSQSPGLWNENGQIIPANVPRSIPIEVMFDMAMACNSSLWMHAPTFLGGPETLNDPAVANDGTRLRSIAKANARAIIASEEWRLFAKEIARSLKASAYPKERMLYVEISNEVWNDAFPFWRAKWYFWGLGEGLKSGAGWRFALGYATANLAVILDTELPQGQAWTAVLAGQMANTDTSKQAIEGFKAYFSERNIDAGPYLAHLGGSTASYYHGAFNFDGDRNKSLGLFAGLTLDQWKAKWSSEIDRDPEGLRKRVADYVITGKADGAITDDVGTLPNLIKRRNEHQKLFTDAGGKFIGDYEGESHDWSSAFNNDAKVKAWALSLRYGPDGERMTRAWVEAMKAQNPDAIISNFSSIGSTLDPSAHGWPWLDGYYGEENGRTRGLKPYLRQ